MEALKYHLLPERRLAMQSSRTKPRKSTVGVLYAVGGMDCTKGKYCFANCPKTSTFVSSSLRLVFWLLFVLKSQLEMSVHIR